MDFRYSEGIYTFDTIEFVSNLIMWLGNQARIYEKKGNKNLSKKIQDEVDSLNIQLKHIRNYMIGVKSNKQKNDL